MLQRYVVVLPEYSPAYACEETTRGRGKNHRKESLELTSVPTSQSENNFIIHGAQIRVHRRVLSQ